MPALLALAVGAAGCNPGATVRPPGPPRLVILYATCSLNRGALSPYAEGVPYTPNLAAFAKDAITFTRHVTEAGESGPAFASIFSGTQVDRHGIFVHPARLPDELVLVTEAFRDAGYRTFFWGGHVMASADLNFGQGVEPRRVFPTPLRGSHPRFLDLVKRVRDEPGAKAFVMTNFTVTHAPYSTEWLGDFLALYPGERRGVTDAEIAKYHRLYLQNVGELSFDFPRTVARLRLSPAGVRKLADVLEVVYRSNVWHLDTLFGEVLDRVAEAGLMEESLIAFTADHGEVLYRENVLFPWSHGEQLEPDVLTVPLVMRMPGLAKRRYEGVSRSIDVFPTLAGLARLPRSSRPEIAGVDLSRAVRGEQAEPDLVAYSRTCVPHPMALNPEYREYHRFFPRADVGLTWVSLRQRDRVYKLRGFDGEAWGNEAFDLGTDPGETHNLFDPGRPADTRMARELQGYKQHLVRRYAEIERERAPGSVLPTEEQAERLRSLGYIQ